MLLLHSRIRIASTVLFVVIVRDWINAPCEDPTVTAEAVRFISVQRNAVLMSSGRSECGLWKMFSDSMNMFGF